MLLNLKVIYKAILVFACLGQLSTLFVSVV